MPLASITDPALVLPRVAAAVGAPIEGTRSALDTLIEHFAQTPTLLVLDNLEQVTGAATELDQLLAACPDVTILATSRTVLRLRAEREYPVEALTVPAFAERPPLEELAALPAVRLFVDRARAVRHDFTLDDTNAAAVMEICRRLDGLPLAIELAAARTRVLAPVALLARLEHVLDSLGTGPVDLPERQRTLRATVEWSFGLLDDPERELVEALSVFADGWTIDAATRVVARTEDETLDLLDALAGHSLVSVVADDAWTALPHARDGAGARRRAARRRRRRCRRRPATRRVLRRAGDATSAGRRNDRSSGPIDWASRRRTCASRSAGSSPTTSRRCPHMFRVLWLFWQMRDRMTEGRAWIDELRPRADSLDEHARAEVLFTWAVTAVEVGDDAAALAAIDAIERFDGPVDDPHLQSALQLAVAWTLPIRDDFDGALEAASDALDGFRRRDEPFVAFAELTVGMLEMTLGRADSARPHLERVDELGSRYGNNWLEASARTQLASLAVSAGELEAARALLDRSVDAIDATHLSTLTLTFALVTAAQLALGRRRPSTSRDRARRRPRVAAASRADRVAADPAPGRSARRARGGGQRPSDVRGRVRRRRRAQRAGRPRPRPRRPALRAPATRTRRRLSDARRGGRGSGRRRQCGPVEVAGRRSGSGP